MANYDDLPENERIAQMIGAILGVFIVIAVSVYSIICSFTPPSRGWSEPLPASSASYYEEPTEEKTLEIVTEGNNPIKVYEINYLKNTKTLIAEDYGNRDYRPVHPEDLDPKTLEKE